MSGRATYNPTTGRCQWAQYSASPGRALYKGTWRTATVDLYSRVSQGFMLYSADGAYTIPTVTAITDLRDTSDAAKTKSRTGVVYYFNGYSFVSRSSTYWDSFAWATIGQSSGKVPPLYASAYSCLENDHSGGHVTWIKAGARCAALGIRRKFASGDIRRITFRVSTEYTFAAKAKRGNTYPGRSETFNVTGWRGGVFEIVGLSSDPEYDDYSPVLDSTTILFRGNLSDFNDAAIADGWSPSLRDHIYTTREPNMLTTSEQAGNVVRVQFESSWLAGWANGETRWFGVRIREADWPRMPRYCQDVWGQRDSADDSFGAETLSVKLHPELVEEG
jgi:hypothetical protein